MILEIVESFKQYLEVKYPSHLPQYTGRLNGEQFGARAEAVMYSALRQECEEVLIAESPSHGGLDFLCTVDEREFLVEVTALAPDVVSERSSLYPDDPVGSFSLLTHTLRNRVSRKTRQMAGSAVPRVLAIATEHDWGGVLLGPLGAQSLLASDLQIAVPVGGAEADHMSATNLADSAFFRPGEGGVESCRRSVSAVLLVAIGGGKCEMVGVLHPDPVHPFAYGLFPQVPFVRLVDWPIEEGEFEIEWVVSRPTPAQINPGVVRFNDEELRAI